MHVKFLGVRGTTPCCEADYGLYGGHTSCVAITCDQQLFIFDAGSGIKNSMSDQTTTHLFFSHFHLDHIMGLPFYPPLWRSHHHVHFYAGTLASGVQSFCEDFLSPPIFPVAFQDFPAQKSYHDFKPGHQFAIGAATVKTIALNHPNGCIGYRLTASTGQSVCYITDHEHDSIQHNPDFNRDNLVDFIKETDLLIYDGTYNTQTFQRGFGHSTHEEGVRLGQDAAVQKIVLCHHDPAQTDVMLAEQDKHLMQRYGRYVQLARQGDHMVIE